MESKRTGRPIDGHLLALAEKQAREVAAKGEVAGEPVVRQVVAALEEWQGAGQASADEVAAWAFAKAMSVAGGEIVYRRALEVARRQHSAERAGVSPEDVGQHVYKRYHEVKPGPFETVGNLRSWAGTVAINSIYDRARHLKVIERAEDMGEELAQRVHAVPPRTSERLAAERHDLPRQVATIAFYLRGLVARQFWLQVEAAMVGEDRGGADEIADELGTTPGVVYKNRVVIRRMVRKLQRAGVIELDLSPAKRRGEKPLASKKTTKGKGK